MRLRGARRLWLEWGLIALALVLFSLWSFREQWTWRMDLAIYDAALSLWQREPPADIVIVAIDDASLAAHGRWPWPRPVIARLLEQVAAGRPAGVGVDLLLTEPDLDPSADARLAAAIARLPRGVLATFQAEWSGERHFVEPLPRFAAAAGQLGHVHVEIDPDAVVRSVYLLEGPSQPDMPHVALALAQRIGSAPALLPGERRTHPPSGAPLWQRDHWFRVPFSGPPGHVMRISAATLLAGIDLDRLRGKQVLVGATAAGLGEGYAVPTSGASRLMPGVEISAQVLDALHARIDIRDPPSALAQAAGPLAVLVTMLSYLVLRPRGALLATFGVAAGLAGGAVLALRLGHLWYPPASALAAVLTCYPLWSWRRLDASLGFMREELKTLQSEPDPLPLRDLPVAAAAPGLADIVQRSIEAVRTANERMHVLRRFVVDAISLQADGVLVLDAAGQVVLCNARAHALLGTDADIQGRSAREVFARLRDADEQLGQILAAPPAGSGPRQAEARTAQGRELLITATACHGESIIGHIVNITDVTALKAAARAREEAVGFLSHDLRAPQAAILSVLELRRSQPDSISEAQLLDQIERSARHTLALADAFVTLTRADHLDPTHFRAVDIADVCREMRDEAWPLCRAKDMRCELRFQAEEAWVAGERALLAAAVLNLLDNAIKYSPRGSEVELALERQGETWIVALSDRGPGIEAQDLPKLFERFRRLRSEGRETPSGAGLGLVIVDTVIRKHNGRVSVRSTPGAGTTFALHLPAAAANDGAA